MKTIVNDFKPETAIYTPAEVATYGKQQVEKIQEQKYRAINFPVVDVDKYFAPMLPGQVCAIIAQTSNYKSGFMHFWEYQIAKQLEAEDRANEVVIHVSVEECVEEQAFLLFARETGENAGEIARGQVQDWDRLNQAAIKVGTIPIYRIGDSLARAEDFPNLYLSNIVRSIQHLRDKLLGHKLEIAAIFFDYLQAFPIDPEIRLAGQEAQRRLQVRSDIYRLRYAAAYFDAPVIIGVQAKQHLDGAPDKKMYIPGTYDGEESSSIAQRCDRIIQLWMPKQNFAVGETITYKDLEYPVEENIIWLKVGKQRGGLPSGRAWKCRINFNQNTIAPETNGVLGDYGN